MTFTIFLWQFISPILHNNLFEDSDLYMKKENYSNRTIQVKPRFPRAHAVPTACSAQGSRSAPGLLPCIYLADTFISCGWSLFAWVVAWARLSHAMSSLLHAHLVSDWSPWCVTSPQLGRRKFSQSVLPMQYERLAPWSPGTRPAGCTTVCLVGISL